MTGEADALYNSASLSREEHIAAYQATARPILADLRALGVSVDRIQDLCRRDTNEPAAIPVLSSWLERIDNPWVAITIAQVMTMPFMRRRPVINALLNTFESAPNDVTWLTAKWSMANALSLCAQPPDASRIAALLQNKQYGDSRQMLCTALVRARHPDTKIILLGLLDEMPLHAISGLKRLRDPSAIIHLQRFVGDDRAAVRHAAKKAIERLTQIEQQAE